MYLNKWMNVQGPTYPTTRDKVMGTIFEPIKCNVCAEYNVTIKHLHYSCSYYHSFLKEKQLDSVLCPSCKTYHTLYHDTNDRITVFYGPFELLNAIELPEFRLPEHINLELASDLDVISVGNHFKHHYFTHPLPLDVYILCDTKSSLKFNELSFTGCVNTLDSLVKSQNPLSTCIFLPLLKPPILYDLRNQTDTTIKIDTLNLLIQDKNLRNGEVSVPPTQMYGIRYRRSIPSHRYSHWYMQNSFFRPNDQGLLTIIKMIFTHSQEKLNLTSW